VERDFTRNLLAASGWEVGWGFGSACVSGAVLNALLLQLTDSKTLIGAALPALPLSAFFNQWLAIKRFAVALLHVAHTLPYVVMGVLLGVLWQHPSTMLVLLFVLLLVSSFFMGLLTSPSFDLLNTLFGRYYGSAAGVRLFANRVGAAIGGLAATVVLRHWSWPTNFVLVVLLGGCLLVGSNVFPLAFREPAPSATQPSTSLRRYWGGLGAYVLRHQEFLALLWVVALAALFNLALGFYVVFALDFLHIPAAWAGLIAALGFIANGAGGLAGGPFGDAVGHRALLRAALAVHGVALAVLLAGGVPGFFVAWVLANMAMVCVDIALIKLTMDFAPAGQKGTYVTVSRLISIPVAGTATLLGGVLVDIFGYQPVFLLALLIPATAFVLTSRFPDPKQGPQPPLAPAVPLASQQG